MELKRRNGNRKLSRTELLIVPYGIETSYMANNRRWGHLLIVPYGIETFLGILL